MANAILATTLQDLIAHKEHASKIPALTVKSMTMMATALNVVVTPIQTMVRLIVSPIPVLRTKS